MIEVVSDDNVAGKGATTDSRHASGGVRAAAVNASKPSRGLRWPLRLAVSRSEGVKIMTLEGRIASGSSALLADALDEALSAGDRRIVIDFEGVDYISGAGLSALEAAAGKIRDAGGAVVLSGIEGPVRTAFQLASLVDRFQFEPTTADAIRHVSVEPK